MRFLFPPSSRPDLVLDPWSTRTADPSSGTSLGYQGPLGRERCVSALSTGANGPRLVEPPAIVVDQDGFSLGDPSGNLLGQPGVVIHRLLSARWTENTRR